MARTCDKTDLVLIRMGVSNEVDDEMNMNDFSTWIHNFARVMLKQDQLSVMVS